MSAQTFSRGSLTRIALTKELYQKEHPNRASHPDERATVLSKISRKDILHYWSAIRGTGGVLLVVVGDITVPMVKVASQKAFSFWSGSTSMPYRVESKIIPKPLEKRVAVPHKTSIDIVLGSRLGIHKNHPDYYPLAVLMGALGSDFSARLFQEVREKRGLTYGIYSNLDGLADHLDGHWYIWATFAPQL